MPSAAATRRAIGEIAGAVPSPIRRWFGRRSPGRIAGGCGGRAAGAGTATAPRPAPAVIRAITWPTVTVSPSSARISVIVPEAGAGSSMSTLSVEISTTVSPSLTVSPTFTAHSRIVPSVTDSPPVGVTMSIVRSPVGGRCDGRRRSDLGLGGGAGAASSRRRRRRLGGHRGGAATASTRRLRCRRAVGRDLGQQRADRDGLALGGVDLDDRARDRAREPRRRPCRSRSRRASRRPRPCRPPACATRAPCPRRRSRPSRASRPGPCRYLTAISTVNCNAVVDRRAGFCLRAALLGTTNPIEPANGPSPPSTATVDGQPERDDPRARGGDADQRHRRSTARRARARG